MGWGFWAWILDQAWVVFEVDLVLVIIIRKGPFGLNVSQGPILQFCKSVRAEVVYFPNCYQGPILPITNIQEPFFSFFHFSKFPGTYFAKFEILGTKCVILENL